MSALGIAWLAGVAALAPAGVALADPVALSVTASPPAGSVLVASGDGSFSFAVAGGAVGGATVVVSAPDPSGGPDVELCSTVADAGEDWGCTITSGPDTPGPLRVVSGADQVLLDVALLHAPVITTDPATPGALASTGTPDSPAQTISGTGAPGALLTLSVSDGSGCTTTVGGDGTWACVLGSLPVGADLFTLVASQAYPFAPGTAAESEPVAFVPLMTTIVPGGPVDPVDPVGPVDPPEPPAPGPSGSETPGGVATHPEAPGIDTATPPNAVDTSVVGMSADGDGHVSSAAAEAGEPRARSHPSPGDVGTAPPAAEVATGAGSSSPLSRSGAGTGTGTATALGAASGSEPRDGTSTSEAIEAAAGDGAAESGPSGRDASGGRFGLALRDVNAVLSLPPSAVVFAGLLVGAIALLVWLPGGLLESTLHENHHRIRRSPPVRFVTALTARLLPSQLRTRIWTVLDAPSRPTTDESLGRRAGAGIASARRWPHSRMVAAGVAVVVAAGAAVVVVPDSGFDEEGVRTFLCFLIALIIVNAVPLVAVGGFVARRMAIPAGRVSAARALVVGRTQDDGLTREAPRVGVVPVARWTALGLTVLTVIVSRAAGLEPGFVFGTVIALQFGIRLARPMAASVTVIATTASLAVGVLAWAAASAIRPSDLRPSDLAAGAPWAGLAAEVLTAVTVCALSGPVVSLVPMRFLDGHGLFAASKRVWAVLYAAAATLFVVVLLPLPEAWSELGGDLAAWLVALGLITALSLGVWAYFRFVPERLSPQDDHPSAATGKGTTGVQAPAVHPTAERS